jgi:plastocyanin
VPRGRALKAIIVPAMSVTAMLLFGACGDDGGSATCNPSGTELHIAVLESRPGTFNTDCLAAPAGEPFTIQFDNQDTSSLGNHNIHIFGGGALFVGDIARHGTSITYEVGALEAGTYQFRCGRAPHHGWSLHREMTVRNGVHASRESRRHGNPGGGEDDRVIAKHRRALEDER